MSADAGITIIIPEYGQPNWCAQALRGLAMQSALVPQILVVYSRPDAFGFTSENVPTGRLDFGIGHNGSMRRHYKSIDDVRAAFRPGVFPITYLDVTDQMVERFGRGPFLGGFDIAAKVQIGLSKIDTEWVLPNWDCDFYPSIGWDRPVRRELTALPPRTVVAMVHCQWMEHCSRLEPIADPWEDTRGLVSNVLHYPPAQVVAGGPEPNIRWTTLPQWNSWWIETARVGVTEIERCAQRRRWHYLPMIWRTDELHELGGFDDTFGTGYEVEIDNRAGKEGFTKIGVRDAAILHKCYIAGAAD